ncbi:Transmembrane protein [Parasponia andersonii]|uniref:Transmembrane protein n=1 Tax=Parasponia andersonii TaxID=3476 RepID=A0A2P5CS85_PARAD|nr:Transmembrane protein [Parasponia andersonii]
MDPKIYKVASKTPTSENSGKKYFTDLDSKGVAQVTCGKGNTIFHVVAKSGNKQAAEEFLSTHPSLAYQTNYAKGDTPLHVAARLGHLEFVTLLVNYAETNSLEEGINPVRKANVEKNTALHEAVKNGHIDIVRFLIEKDSVLASLTNNAGESPLFLALDRKFSEIALFILEKTFPICSFSGRNGMTVMHAAIIRNKNCKFSVYTGFI